MANESAPTELASICCATNAILHLQLLLLSNLQPHVLDWKIARIVDVVLVEVRDTD